MVGELMTLPLRVGVRATQLWLRAAEQTIAVVAETASRVIGGGASDQSPPWTEPRYEAVEQPAMEPPPAPTDEPAPADKPAPRDEPAPQPREPAPRAPSPYESPPVPEPTHVSEEPELVEEVAEPGAENGAGASIHVEAPWDGYDRMKAADVADRLTGVSPAVLAAVQLYETGTKGRKTVLDAVERELRNWAGSGSHS